MNHTDAAVRVVRVIARLNVGGPAIHVLNLAAGMSTSYPTLLVAGNVDAGEVEIPAALATDPRVRLWRIPELGRRVRPWQDLLALLRLYRLFRALRPEIVHTHTAKAGTLGRIAAVLARVPVRVHTFHGHVLRGYFSPLRTRLVVYAERLLAKFTTCILTVSERQASELVRDFRICRPERMRVIELGFDFSRFDPDSLGAKRGMLRREIEAGSSPIVSAVGRLVPIKNHRLLLDAAAALRDRGVDFVLAIVGGGPEEEALRTQAERLGLASRVRFLGWRDDLDVVYADSDLVVLSSDNEGTPVCLIEALASGCAVVATDVGGVQDVLENGRLGTVVPPGDSAALADAMERLLTDSMVLRRGAAAGPTAARERFGVERLVADMNSLYDEMLGHGAPSEG